jgi:PAS domain S-box-containing protein
MNGPFWRDQKSPHVQLSPAVKIWTASFALTPKVASDFATCRTSTGIFLHTCTGNRRRMEPLAKRFLSTASKIFFLALAYFVAGRLGLLLAIPPGFASAVFPAIGIGIGAVLIWGYPLLAGVFLGSVLLNLSIPFSIFGSIDLNAMGIATAIAMGSSAQSLVGTWLIRRMVNLPTPMIHFREIALVLGLAGPLSCLISACVGPFALYHGQVITWSELPMSIWTWWVGDSLGVLTAMPLMFIVFAAPRSIWRTRARSVGIPLVCACLLAVAAFLWSSAFEQSMLRQRFHSQAKTITAALLAKLDNYRRTVGSIERLFVSSTAVTPEEYRTFVANLPAQYPGIVALSWNRYIDAAQRDDFERAMSLVWNRDFHITTRADDGALQVAPQRVAYVPVTYIEPLGSNQNALGYDVSSEEVRNQALQSAAHRADVAMSGPIHLVQNSEPTLGFLLFQAIYEGSEQVEQAALTRHPNGYAVAVVRMNDLVDRALGVFSRDDFDVDLADVTDGENRPFYGRLTDDLAPALVEFQWSEEIQWGGRLLHLRVAPTEHFLRSHRSLQSWYMLAAALLFCSTLCAFLLFMTGNAETIRTEVRQRTLELATILEKAAEGILIFDEDGRIERTNDALARLFSRSSNAVESENLRTLMPTLADLKHDAREDLLGKSFEVHGLGPNQEPLELEATLGRYELAGRTRYICLLRDIRERKRVERLKDEFVSTVSHELRTPLTSIKGSLALVQAGTFGEFSGPAQELVNVANRNADRLIAVVNDLLDIGKLEAGEHLKCTLQTLYPILHEAIALNRGYAATRDVELVLNVEALPGDAEVEVDAARLLQVLNNLISNAVKFSDPKHPVEISAVLTDDDHVRVAVRDYGAGIPDDFRGRIFSKFAQADGSNSRRVGGTGLGLAIVKALVERMRGEIEFESEVGRGSTFFFTLPLADWNARSNQVSAQHDTSFAKVS